MRNTKWQFAGALAAALLLVATLAYAAPQTATNFAGTWTVDMQGGGGGNGGGGGQAGGQGGDNSGGGGGRRGMGPSTLVITADGDNYKVVHKTQRGDVTSSATASGSTITWTEERQTRDGNTMKVTWKGTVDGDTMKGTVGGGQFSRDFSAKRGS